MELRILCKSCGKRLPMVSTKKNCDDCNRKYRSNYQNTLCRRCKLKSVAFPTDPMCKDCYKLTEKENAELIKSYKQESGWY